MIRSEKLCEGNLSTSLLEGLTSSDAAQSDCETPCKLKLSSKMTSTRGPHTKVQVLHLLRWITHTHPAGARSTLKGKRKKKADTNDGQKAKTAQGGEGNKRTSTARRTSPAQGTHLNPTTQELGTEWGLVDDGGETTN